MSIFNAFLTYANQYGAPSSVLNFSLLNQQTASPDGNLMNLFQQLEQIDSSIPTRSPLGQFLNVDPFIQLANKNNPILKKPMSKLSAEEQEKARRIVQRVTESPVAAGGTFGLTQNVEGIDPTLPQIGIPNAAGLSPFEFMKSIVKNSITTIKTTTSLSEEQKNEAINSLRTVRKTAKGLLAPAK